MKNDKTVKRNFWCFVLDGAIYFGGATMIHPHTIIPVFLKKFTSNEYLINLASGIEVMGTLLPQLFMARYQETLAYKKWLLVFLSIILRIPWLLMAIVIPLVAGNSAWIPLLSFFIGYAVFQIILGLNIPVWADLFAKLMPVNLRGTMTGVRRTAAGILGLGTAILAKVILDKIAFPMSFALLFGIAFVIKMISLIPLMLIKEHKSPETKTKVPVLTYLRGIPGILQKNRNYRNFLFSRIIFTLAMMLGGLITAYGIDTFALENRDSLFALVSLFTVIGEIIVSLIMGKLGDKYGYKNNLIIIAVLSMISMILLILYQNLTLFILALVIYNIIFKIQIDANINISFEFCKEKDRPTYVTIVNTIISPISFAAPFIGAFFVDILGYLTAFHIVFFLLAIYTLYVLFFVKEPRNMPIID